MDNENPTPELHAALVGTPGDQLAKTLLAATAGYFTSRLVYHTYNTLVIARRG